MPISSYVDLDAAGLLGWWETWDMHRGQGFGDRAPAACSNGEAWCRAKCPLLAALLADARQRQLELGA